MRKSILTLSLAVLLGAAGTTFVAAQPQRPAATQGGPVNRDALRAQRPAPTPEQRAARRADMCRNLHARVAGRLAALEVQLNLSANQRAAFNSWRDTRLAAAKRRADACVTQPGPQGRGAANAATRPSPVERMARQEQMLRQRLADLTAERPALEALYNSLSAEQRQKLTPQQGPRRAGMGRDGPNRDRVMMLRDRGPGGPRPMMRAPQANPPAPAQ